MLDPTDAKLKWLQAPARLAAGRRRPGGVHRHAARRARRGRGLRLHARRARSSRSPPARRRWTSPTRSTPTSATAASARRSTARSCRCTTSCSRATSSRSSPPSASAARRATGWRVVKTTRARNKIRAWFKAESREDSEHTGRRAAPGAPAQGRPAGAEDDRLAAARRRDPRDGLQEGRRLLHRARRRQDLAEGRRQQGAAAPQAGRVRRSRSPPPPRCCSTSAARAHRRPESSSSTYGIRVEGVDDVPLRLAKCCRPVSGDPILGYVSLGRGITIHREDCPNVVALRKDPERFVPVAWDGDNETSLQGRAPGRRLGPPPPARGPLAHVRRGRHQHRRGALHRLAPDGQEPLRRRGRRTPRRSRARSSACARSTRSSTPTGSPRAAAASSARATRSAAGADRQR